VGDKINFPNRSDFFDFIDEIQTAYREDRITDFVCMVRVKSERKGESARIGYKWFGDISTLYLRGMLRRLDDMMAEHMNTADSYEEL